MNRNSTQDRCTEADYRQLFSSHSTELHEFCFMLTADEQLAKTSFNAALERTVKDAASVFRDWMWSWARRQIIKTCIAALRPEIQHNARSAYSCGDADLGLLAADQPRVFWDCKVETLQRRVLKLDVLARFVFVLRSFAGYSARETALLLDIDSTRTALAYKSAIEAITSTQLGFLHTSGPGPRMLTEAR